MQEAAIEAARVQKSKEQVEAAVRTSNPESSTPRRILDLESETRNPEPGTRFCQDDTYTGENLHETKLMQSIVVGITSRNDFKTTTHFPKFSTCDHSRF